MDELDALRIAIATEGTTVPGSTGQPRAHPALGELRQGRGELRRLLDALGIPQPLAAVAEGEAVVSIASRRATRAASARWDRRGRSAGA